MTKKRNIVDIIAKFINSIFAIALLLAYVIVFLEPKNIGIFSVLSVFTPVLLLINVAFVVYWLIRLKKETLISVVVLALGYTFVNRFYSFGSEKMTSSNLSIMSYNVRGFNVYKWIDKDNIPAKISSFIQEKSPDIVCFQEYYASELVDLSDYKFNYIKGSSKTQKFGQAIFSKHKIIHSGSLDFVDTANNAVYVDVLRGKDTLRIYNIHLQSLKVGKLTKNISDNKEKLLDQISVTNKKQQEQVQQIIEHKANCTYKTILCGDFNNTAFSYSYNQLIADMKDTFVVRGTGFGKTYDAFYFPYRIDFIFSSEAIKIADFETYSETYSDHKPIVAKLAL